jgi:hypothetical protein
MLLPVFHLTLRGTEGVVRHLFEQSGVSMDLAPDFSTLCKRRSAVRLRRPQRAGEVALIDAAGFSFRVPGTTRI